MPKEFFSYVKNYFSTNIKTIGTENGIEFVNVEVKNLLDRKYVLIPLSKRMILRGNTCTS